MAERENKAVAHEDRSIGCLLGTACGDILGAAVEGWPATDIRRGYGQLRDFLDTDRGYGCYTDDTQMTLALADGLRQEDDDKFVIARVGNGIRAAEAVAAALWAFLRYGGTPEECIIRAVGFGGDTDTIGAMAGALVGALHGTAWIPARWYEIIENGRHGRDEIVVLGRRLARLEVL